MNVLFVCTGNVCRSPMAEGFLRQQAAQRGLPVEVRSTGTHAWEGRAATMDGRRVMADLGAPIDGHRTLVLDEPLIAWADLIVGLAWEHSRDVMREYPSAAGKTATLKDLVRVAPGLRATNGDFAELAVAAVEADPEHGSRHLDDTDVHDPFGEREPAYRRVAVEIRDLIADFAEHLPA